MNSNSKCPTAEEFGQLVEGQISNLRCEQLVDHLAACLRCAEAAEQVLANSSIGQALGGHLPDQLPPDDVIEPIIARMRELVLDRSSGGTPTLAAHAASSETVPELEAGHDMAAFFAPPQTANELGRLGGFRILNFLGAGGMGVVFLAEDPLLKRQVALKVLRPSLAVHPGSRERFLREARAMAAVQHDRIMHINQVGEDRRVPFLAMPYLPGETLADRLNRDKKLAVADAVRIAREVAEGLSAAHQRGLIHRDIKPSNIWLEGAHCRVKILDFGLVRTLQEDIQLTRSGNILGTPAYMSPEQASGGEVDDRSDLFSLGCVMYHMCTGHEPFRVGHPAAILLAVMTQDPRPPVQLESELPLALSQLIVRMLAKNSERRPDSADAVVEELRTIEASLIQQPGPPPPAPAARSSISKKILGVALGVISVAILVAGIVIVRVRNNDGSIVELRTTAEEVEVETDGRTPVKVRRSEHFPVVKDASRPPVKAAASPFDQLNRENIPLHELAAAGNGDPAQAPAELVAVFGDSRLKHWATVNDVEFTKDGRLLVSASDDSTVRLWDTGTGKMVRQLDTEGPTHCLAITPDEKRVVAGFQTSIRIWQIATGQVLRTLTPTRDIPAQIWSLATSPNPELPLVAATCHHSGTITVWNLDTGQELRNIPAHKSTIIDLDFSHDGKWLASAGADDGTAKIWDVETGELLHSFDAQTFVGGVQFTSDGDQLVIGSRQEITIRDTSSGELLRTIPEGADRFVLTPDGDGILLARAHQAWLLRFDSPKEHLVIGWNHLNLNAVSISSDGQYVATAGTGMPLPCSDSAIRLWNVRDGSEVHPSKGHGSSVNCVALRTDAPVPLIASGSTDHTVRLWNPATGDHVRTLSGPAHVNHISFQPRGKHLLAGHGNTNVLWDPETGEKRNEWTVKGWAVSGAFLPDGRALLGGCMDGNVYQWNTSSGAHLQTIDAQTNDVNSYICALAMDLSGRILALGNYERGPYRYDFKLWDRQAGKELHNLNHGCPIRAATFSPDGRRLATAGEWDHNAKIWDVETGRLLYTLSGHQQDLASVCFSPNGTRLATSARDGTIRLWDAWDSLAETTVHVIRLGPAGGHMNQVVFSDDGRHLVTANGNGTVYVLRAPAR